MDHYARRVLDRKLLIVSGKGGVGKSALTAAFAHLAEARGKSVLATAMTDGPGLAAHLGLSRLTYETTRVTSGIAALAVDRRRALDEYLRLQLRLPSMAPISQFTRLFRVLVDTVPGVREIISMGKPIQDLSRGGYDLIVVDAPPLGQLFSYLSAPETVSRLVPSGAVRDQATRMMDSLADPATSGLVLVTTLEELPVVETVAAVARLKQAGVIDLAAVVANRVLEPLEVDPEIVAGLSPGPVRDAASMHMTFTEDQRRWGRSLGPAGQVPFLFGQDSPSEVVSGIVAAWGEP
jgi:anion-transporting  ArsA/GET3 family ATPase